MDALAWPEIGKRAARGALLALPIGSTEQHGPHLPFSVDTDIAVALCDRLATVRGDVVVAPAIAYGSSGEHAGFPGTLSIGQEATELLLVELGRSATQTFGHVLFVCAHGGNAEPVSRAVARLRAESRDVVAFFPQWDGDPHAGRAETSLQLALRPYTVDLTRAVRGSTRPLAELMPALRSGGVADVSPSGVLGDANGASAPEGRMLRDRLTDDLVAYVAGWRA